MFTSTPRTILVAATIASTLSTTLAIPLAPVDAYEFEAREEAETGLQSRGAIWNGILGAAAGIGLGHIMHKSSSSQATPDPSQPGRRSLDEDSEFFARDLDVQSELQARGAIWNGILGAAAGIGLGHIMHKSSSSQATPDPSQPGRRSLDEDNVFFARELDGQDVQARGAVANGIMGAITGVTLGHFWHKNHNQDDSTPTGRSLDEDNESFAREPEADWMLAARELDEQFTRDFEEDFLAARDYEGIDYYYM